MSILEHVHHLWPNNSGNSLNILCSRCNNGGDEGRSLSNIRNEVETSKIRELISKLSLVALENA